MCQQAIFCTWDTTKVVLKARVRMQLKVPNSGAKAQVFGGDYGTTEVVPFPFLPQVSRFSRPGVLGGAALLALR
jgi:hypothetical protein